MERAIFATNGVNWIGLKTLYHKEVLRFWKVWMQTLVAPVVTTLLFMAVFLLTLHNNPTVAPGLDYSHFLIPGLIMMAIVQNAFANASSSLIIAKVNGSIVDLLLPPLSAFEFVTAMTLGAVSRGLLVGVIVALSMLLVIPYTIFSFSWLIYFSIMGAMMLGLLGLLTGIWAEKFDHVATITNFIVTPLSFLSGTFYSVERLPTFWRNLVDFNPFFHMIDGMRYAMTGYSDGSITHGALALLITNILLWALAHRLIRIGYKIRS